MTAILASLILFTQTTTAQQSMSEQEFKNMLTETLKKNPDLIMDILRSHSSEVLAIAQQGSIEKKKAELLKQWEKDSKKNKKIKLNNRPIKGDPNAPILIAVFSDFTCPYCSKTAQKIEEALLDHPTQIKFVFKHHPLESHQYSELAAKYFVATTLQSEAKAWELYKEMFQNREQLTEKGESFILPLIKKLKLDENRLKKDLQSSQVKKIISEDLEDAKNLNFSGAPYLLVNNLVIAGAPSKEVLDLAISEAIRYK